MYIYMYTYTYLDTSRYTVLKRTKHASTIYVYIGMSFVSMYE